ncbi:DEAD/DEAH box helicase family protein [Microbacterium sp. KSW4-17]|uniref:DEAD/DEAH box helicase family protein n=1 Tax=Microbacterium galbum TaxID=3075994 RepID=A0ABU3T2L5_9MICO|nr:DEAD/DEAH box helicase family protein [Microbacterium sp. KSW4-17]MDU0365573.1 DEAD/DEAH box helicase family protein [Microbacterium sp. KSW4-17]
MSTEPRRPLSAWRFDGTLRAYQADALDRVDVDSGGPVHLVAPPGAGKTLLGLLLAARRGRPAVVFAPTTAIRAQWVAAARGLAHDEATVSDDPFRPADLTALTYQAVSVLDTAQPFTALARARWADELVGDERTPDQAHDWLDALNEKNPAAYRRGIRSRSRSVRRTLARQDAAALTSALHPRARDLMDRLVEAGVETIVLDECHHLLDHWALVVAALVARIRAEGREPLVVGLTATLPSPDDANEYDNYVSLLGEVDLEVPVPAVVREGDLAPYRELVHAVEPTDEELAFLSAHAAALDEALRTTFAVGAGREYLRDALQPPAAATAPIADPLAPPSAPRDVRTSTSVGADLARIDRGLAEAFSADFARAEAAAAMFSEIAPDDPLVARLPAVARRAPTTDETVRLLGRYALDRVLPDPDRQADWRRLRRLLADFGYALTDRGVRRTRDPIDTVLASSLAKDRGACDILAVERAQLGDRLRALVVTDFVTHGNVHGGLLGSAGAVRTFSVLSTDAATAALRAVLITSSTVRVSTRHAPVILPALTRELGAELETIACADDPSAVEVRGTTGTGVTGAASRLLAAGEIEVVVGTRGLFGEGWDCPAVNTLVDLTAVATASATQQLRGRTLRLDPQWPEKVAHNWTITAILPPTSSLSAQPDAARLRRKHARLWGLDADRPGSVVRGLGAALDRDRRVALDAVLAKDPGSSVRAVDALVGVPPRADTRAAWRVGTPYADTEEAAVVVERPHRAPAFSTSVDATRVLGRWLGGSVALPAAVVVLAFFLPTAVGAPLAAVAAVTGVLLSVSFGRAWRRTRRQSRDAPATLTRIARVVWTALSESGRVAARPTSPTVEVTGAGGDGIRVEVRMPQAGLDDQRTFAHAVEQLCGPVRSPRFVLEIDRGEGSWWVRRVLEHAGRGRARQFLSVPDAIGRRRDDAVRFHGAWQVHVGPAVLHEFSGPENLALMSEARRAGGFSGATRSMWQWR